jgi:hypothetical protein
MITRKDKQNAMRFFKHCVSQFPEKAAIFERAMYRDLLRKANAK